MLQSKFVPRNYSHTVRTYNVLQSHAIQHDGTYAESVTLCDCHIAVYTSLWKQSEGEWQKIYFTSRDRKRRLFFVDAMPFHLHHYPRRVGRDGTTS